MLLLPHLRNLADQLHLSLQKGHGAFAGPKLCELLVWSWFAGLGVPIAAEDAVGYVEHPLFGLPPGP